MARDLFVYTCLEDYCPGAWETMLPSAVCPECGSPEIEVDHTVLGEDE